jgi:hypothetical protein
MNERWECPEESKLEMHSGVREPLRQAKCRKSLRNKDSVTSLNPSKAATARTELRTSEDDARKPTAVFARVDENVRRNQTPV